ncbi:MAG: ABC transporter ATP-binding protein [Acidobacteriia bacterium]|nr:ABC transporter ATP-binding protein [Terriglobia bacterium]
MTSVLRVDVARRFAGGFRLSAVMDVELRPGSMLVLFGPSGAGKTTILRQLAGLERPDAGTIRLDDEVWCDVTASVWRPPQARHIGLVFQEPTLFPHLTVRDNIGYGVRHGSDRGRTGVGPGSDPVEEIATMLGVKDLANRHPRELSGGEAQRVALARALVPGPRLLLLDEPFGALDMPTRARLRRDVRGLLHRTGTPAILVTHDRTEALEMGDAVVVMIGGRVRQTGPISDVFSHPADVDVAASLGVEAVVPARVLTSSGGLLEVAVGSAGRDVVLQVAERDALAPGADVYACIRAEDVTLGMQLSTHASARNHLEARVVSINAEGPVDRVSLDCGFPLDALITRRSREELNLTPGSQVTAAIKATNVHLVPRI